jgi:hypothetical protein
LDLVRSRRAFRPNVDFLGSIIFFASVSNHVHPRTKKISAKIGKAKHTQSKMRAAISRFASRRVVLDG